jgi:NAD-dependent SIR2 family protein deacetylase
MKEAAKAQRRRYLPGQQIAVDAEELFNAVEALANRGSFEAGPFVAGWHPLIDEMDTNQQADVKQAIKRGLDSMIADLSYSSTDRAAQALTNAIVGNARGSQFQTAASDMISTLKGMLRVKDASRIEYLSPLLALHEEQSGGLLIATLNYDTLIEQLGAANSVEVNDCLDEWCRTGSVQKSEALTLLKLHGSINWIQEQDKSVRRENETDTKSAFGPSMGSRPALIFGGINKLRADGPYLEMLMEWRAHLDQCDHLVVIGYSFRDDHVNAIIDRWHRKDTKKRITIVDPRFNHQASSLAEYLYRFSNEEQAPYEVIGSTRQRRPNYVEAPVQLIREGAATALPTLFGKIGKWPDAIVGHPNPFSSGVIC